MLYIDTLPFTVDWSFEKKTHFNTELNQVSVLPNEVIFDIDDATNCFYMVKQGELLIEAIVTIEEENQFPTKLDKWESQITRREVQFEVHKLNVGEIFGLQDIIEQLSSKDDTADVDENDGVPEMPEVPRKYRVRAITCSTLIFMQNHKIKQCKSQTTCNTFRSLP